MNVPLPTTFPLALGYMGDILGGGFLLSLASFVVATDAVSGGLLSRSEAATADVGATVPVDIWLVGSPPSPFGLINALLVAVGKLADGGKGTR